MLWLSSEFDDAPAAWLTLRERLAGTGLVPLLLSTLEGQPERPWDVGELRPEDPRVLDTMDLTGTIAELWDGGVPDPGELAAAPATVDLPAGIALVRAARPADTLVAIGWTGAVNILDSPAPVALVLRSWEDRFGARLMHVGFDTIALLVERPVAALDQAFAVAAEHFALCTDNITQGRGAIAAYAEELPGATSWWFWWD